MRAHLCVLGNALILAAFLTGPLPGSLLTVPNFRFVGVLPK
jgi:hypothetical protein